MKKKLLCAIIASAACLLSAQSASAKVISKDSQLNTGGTLIGMGATDLNMATGLDFTSGDPSATADPALVLGVVGTGALLGDCTIGVTAESCGTIADIDSFDAFNKDMKDLHFLSGLPGGINFELDGPLGIVGAAASPGKLATLIVSGKGIISGGGFDPTGGIFTLVTQGGIDTTFSASIVSTGLAVPQVPEPASAALFGVGVAGLMLARRKKARQAFTQGAGVVV